jgi:hypothetical protein
MPQKSLDSTNTSLFSSRKISLSCSRTQDRNLKSDDFVIDRAWILPLFFNEGSPLSDPVTIYQEVSQATALDRDSVVRLKVLVEPYLFFDALFGEVGEQALVCERLWLDEVIPLVPGLVVFL